MTERDIFLNAIDHPVSDRPGYLDGACGADSELRRKVNALLAAHDRAGAFLEQPAAGASPTAAFGAQATAAHEAAGEKPGSVVAGRYKLLECIGEGGMGNVWMAEQREPVKRLVAVKLIKPGMDSKSVLARFEAERQALALMDHPNIAKVFDGGTTDEGRPYFVMELVKGIPLTEYSDDRHLTVPQRLELFIQVCSAVQHAHQKGVIHRDLKPTNILVTEHDGKPVPKVIDFGLAKALHSTNVLTERTLHTSFGAVVGTPLYMAPEQVGINALDVDTRTDVYALGVLLYELLTGSTPIERARMKEAMWDEIRRLIREEEPPKPSTRLSTSNALPSLAARRHVEPAKLSKLVRGELDWIVMKALEKDRNRRYETANGLGMDVKRYLAGDQVQAVPPSVGYRVRKFVRRNRPAVLTTTAVAVGLLLAAAGLTWNLMRARAAERRAVAAESLAVSERDEAEGQRRTALAERDRAVKAEELARQEAATSRAVRDFLQADLLRQADVTAQAEAKRLTGGGFDTKANPTINELLDRAAAGLAPDRIGAKFAGQPRVQAEILDTLGQTYWGIGESTKAVEHLTRAVALYQTSLGPDDPTTLAARHALALAHTGVGKIADAVTQFEQVRDARAARLGPDDPDTLTTLTELGLTYSYVSRSADAIAALERAHERLTRTMGPDALPTLKAQFYLAKVYQDGGRLDDALAQAAPAWDRGKKLLAADHPYAITAQYFLADLYRQAGRHADAIPLLRAILNSQTARLGPTHVGNLHILSLLSRAYQDAGRADEALPFLKRTVESERQKNGPAHPATQRAVQGLAVTLATHRRYAEAVAVAREQSAAVRVKDGAASPAYALTLMNLGRAFMWQSGVPDGAETVTREAVALYRALGDTSSHDYSGALSNRGLLLLRQGKYAEAEPVLRECLALRQKLGNAWGQANTSSMLGDCLLGQARLAEAEPLLRAGYEGMWSRTTWMPLLDRDRYAEAADRLVRLCEATHRTAEAAKWRTERAKWSAEQAPPPRAAK